MVTGTSSKLCGLSPVAFAVKAAPELVLESVLFGCISPCAPASVTREASSTFVPPLIAESAFAIGGLPCALSLPSDLLVTLPSFSDPPSSVSLVAVVLFADPRFHHDQSYFLQWKLRCP
jgi:hypothetical protein